jgi:prevent-host-death family protein
VTAPVSQTEPAHIEEPRALEEYADVLTRVATDRRPVIVRRNGADLAAVVPLEHLELLQEVIARQEAERLAAQIDWDRASQSRRPPQQWFDDDDNPFEPEEAGS